MLARQEERPPPPAPAAQGMVRRRPIVMASSAQAGCHAPARAASTVRRCHPGDHHEADPDGRRGVTRAPAPLSGGVPAMAPPMAPLGRPGSGSLG
eukprot:scaffold13693_cov140-Isochrysis_galbana.AAC.1